MSRRSETSKCRGEQSEMCALQLGTAGCIMDGAAEDLEREAAAAVVVVRADCDGLGWGLSRAELNPGLRGH